MDWVMIGQSLFPVLAMLLLGVLARKTRVLAPEGAAGLKALVMNITLPAVVLSTLMSAEYTGDLWLLAGMMLLAATAAWLMGKALTRVLPGASPMLPYMTSGFEAGMIGYALVTTLYGAENLLYMAVMDVGQMIFIFTIYLASLNAVQGDRSGFRENAVSMLKTPVVDAAILGLLLGASGWGARILDTDVSAVLKTTMEFVAAPTGAVILLVVGYGLELGKIEWRGVRTACLSRLVILTLLGGVMIFFETRLFAPNTVLYAITALEFMLPAPYLLGLVVRDPAQRATVSSVLSLSTLWTIAVFAVLVVIRG